MRYFTNLFNNFKYIFNKNYFNNFIKFDIIKLQANKKLIPLRDNKKIPFNEQWETKDFIKK